MGTISLYKKGQTCLPCTAFKQKGNSPAAHTTKHESVHAREWYGAFYF